MILTELLDDSTIRKIEKILSEERQPHKRLMEILEPHREKLLAKEVFPEWLAYFLEYLSLPHPPQEIK